MWKKSISCFSDMLPGILAQAVVKIKYIHDISMGDVQYIDGLPMKNHFYFNAYRSLNSEILLDIRIKISKTKIFIKTKTFQTQLRIQSKLIFDILKALKYT